MRYNRDDGYDRLATFDIETTHYKPAEGETVSVGVGVHDRRTPGSDATYEPFHRNSADDEAELIERALEFIDDCGADALVSFNGHDFDLEFLNDRLHMLGESKITPDLAAETHIDLFADRKAKCDRTGEKWPKLEECLATYEFDEPETLWNDDPVTNVRFGEELGPAYLEALSNGETDRVKADLPCYL